MSQPSESASGPVVEERSDGTNKNDTSGGNDGKCSRSMTISCAVAAALFLISTVVLAILLSNAYGNQQPIKEQPIKKNESDGKGIGVGWPLPSGSGYGQYKRAAVSTDHGLCSEIARDVMLLGGNAIDSTIAALFCIGVMNPLSSGLGGGFLMTLYNSTTRKCTTIDARESAPLAASESMYVERPSEAYLGYRSVAVPSELNGLWTVYTKFGSGKVPWSRLIEPSIELALNGFPISSYLALWLSKKKEDVFAAESLRDVFVNPSTQQLYREGDVIRRKTLAATLQRIANSSDPLRLFYQGEMAETIANEMKENGGYITMDDLRGYETLIQEAPLVNEDLPGGLAICGPPPPSSFAVAASIITVMAEFYGTEKDLDLNDPLVYHRLIEAEKFAYARRSQLGDIAFVPDASRLATNMTSSAYAKWIKSLIKSESQPSSYYTSALAYQPEDHGTSHVSALDPQGNAVSCTDTINQILGSKRISPTLGIVWNDEMDDFSTPGQVNLFGYAPSEANFIAPGKRPLSSMSPSIVYNKSSGKVKLVVGASGGSKITSSVAQTAIRSLLFNQTVKQAVDSVRFHNQFTPYVTDYEAGAPQELISILESRFKQEMKSELKSSSSVQAIAVTDDGTITVNGDFRRKTDMHPGGF